MSNLKFETLQLHTGQQIDQYTNATAVPFNQAISYFINNVVHAPHLFWIKEIGNN